MKKARPSDPELVSLLGRLGSRQDETAWSDFVERYSSLILQTVRASTTDPDEIADLFLFACEELCRDGCRRLRRFRVDGPASFATWLRAVVRNLCLDWHRRRHGRYRVFRSIAEMPAVDQEIFRAVYWDGLDHEAALLLLRPRFPELDRERLEAGTERIRRSLSPRQIWLLSQKKTEVRSLEEGSPAQEIPDSGDDPETLVLHKERWTALQRGLDRLPSTDRLLVRLRFEQGLTLAEVGRLTGLGNAQKIDRKIRKVLGILREALGLQ